LPGCQYGGKTPELLCKTWYYQGRSNQARDQSAFGAAKIRQPGKPCKQSPEDNVQDVLGIIDSLVVIAAITESALPLENREWYCIMFVIKTMLETASGLLKEISD